MEQIIFTDEDGLVVRLEEANCIRFNIDKNEVKIYINSPTGEYTYIAENILNKIRNLITKTELFYPFKRDKFEFFLNLESIGSIDTKCEWHKNSINFKNGLAMNIKNFSEDDAFLLAQRMQSYFENSESEAVKRALRKENAELRARIESMELLLKEIHKKTEI